MYVEIAEIEVTDPSGFEDAVRQAEPLFLAAKGCHGLSLHRVVENPDVYRLIVKWETVENHTVDFRQSDAFGEWRRLASPFFRVPPTVTHSKAVI
ncbi:Quinol monooxygenase YgiN [Aureimonas altamirensis DSM 21988]|uniref:Antibiotic biosynthesis monooxygenase n=2 Tax=Aureimonas altamirensis TaxID=370622 RepID=A0A0P0YVS8_9HYPH|nr:antibiotic biosynthesis monooxygenase family protein [Aureimonas altamirensis]BAT25470.1 antibiotic biosynthesis monooxygenase [Aureimonas altamirensis]SHK01889.1 Quinol monooxygenase YgiN [Aureimonas altamirensis DSM 21988]